MTRFSIHPPRARATRAALAATLLALSVSQAGATPDPATIVRDADRVRFPDDGFQVDVRIRTEASAGAASERHYRIVSKGIDKTLVMTTYPASEKGQILLMRDDDLWVFMPAVSQPIRLPLSQKLTGQVANGDLARANFSGDYNAKLLRTERIDGDSYYVLELLAARRGVTYHRVLYWVNSKNHWPYKAEFYTASNRLMKRARYTRFKKMGGATRPTRLLMEDTLRSGERSVMEYAQMVKRQLPEKVFTKQYLKKLKR